MSPNVHPYHTVRLCPVLQCPVLQFQRPPCGPREILFAYLALPLFSLIKVLLVDAFPCKHRGCCGTLSTALRVWALLGVSAKLHYTDTGYGHVVKHHQRTSSQQFYNLLYNKFTTNGQKFATSQHFDMSRCWALALRCGKFVVQQVVELL